MHIETKPEKPMPDQAAIKADNLHKSFGDNHAVNDISFEVPPGRVYSLLGPNGAGKSTTISMLACLQEPDSGEAWILGHSILRDPPEVKASLGVVPQDIALYEDLTARENLEFWGRMYGLPGPRLHQRVDEVLKLIGLSDRQKERIDSFSGGMKRRVNIAAALLHTPRVLILDEPTVGIDPQSRRHILDGILEFNRQGVTVLYTTHYMEEAQELSDHIGIMDNGQMIASGSHDELVKIVGQQDRITLQINPYLEGVLETWRSMEGVSKVVSENGAITALVEDSNLLLPDLFEAANAAGVRITSVEIEEPNLESVFLLLTGRALRD
jgi:ABC-2 type transport system ATP-binding protein